MARTITKLPAGVRVLCKAEFAPRARLLARVRGRRKTPARAMPLAPHAAPSARRLAALLRDRRDELLTTWTQRVIHDPRVPEASRLTEPDLRDHLPELLDDVIHRLETINGGEAGGREVGGSESAREHARHRGAVGYRLTEALRELSHFRAAIGDLCIAENVALELDAAQLLHAAIDECMTIGADELERAEVATMRRQGEFRERFMGILGHDLRNPLQAVVFTTAALLRREDTTAGQAQLLQRINGSASRMGRMIADLLDVTRVRLGGGLPIDPAPARLDDIARQVVDELQAAKPGRIVELSATDVRGTWDADRIAQVLSNLVGNALDHSPPDRPVRVRVRRDSAGAILAVSNEGEPIAPEALPTIFVPFVRSAPSMRAGGLGLGLFIAQQIVEAHGGTLTVVSAPGEGTTFTAWLPARKSGAASQAA
jgi:signal transduction histidine kinase